MTITKTADVEGTLQQIYALAAAGCDIVRCTCNEPEAAEGLAQIVPRSPVPIIADIHHQYRMALAALEAGVHGLRLNPGNIRRAEHIKAVADRGPRPRGLDPHRRQRRLARRPPVREARRHHARGDGRVGAARAGLLPGGRLRPRQDLGQGLQRPADGRGLPPAVARPPTTRCTSVSPRPDRRPPGWSRPPPGSPPCCMEGIGDTIRYSLTADPVEEARAGRQLLEALGLRERKNVDLIACPSCGRAEVDVIDVANRALQAFGDRKLPLQVAVMGCVVNGPGEAREADLGIAAGNKRGHLFVKGRNVAVVPEDRDGRRPRRVGRVHQRARGRGRHRPRRHQHRRAGGAAGPHGAARRRRAPTPTTPPSASSRSARPSRRGERWRSTRGTFRCWSSIPLGWR